MSTLDLADLASILRALAHESRLRLLALVADRERSVRELAGSLGLTEPTVSHHLAHLAELDLVRMRAAGTTHYYRLNAAAFQGLNKALARPKRMASLAGVEEVGDAWEQGVLRRYFDGDRLVQIPVTRKKRDVILRWLVGHFAEGRRYSEKEINETLKRFHPDTATLRREFIMTRLMERDHGVYWRVRPDPDPAGEGRRS